MNGAPRVWVSFYVWATRRTSTWDGSSGALVEGVAYWGGQPLEYYANGYAHYLHTNWLGTMRMVTNNTGGVDGEFISLPFGDSWTVTSGASNDGYQFAGLDIDSTDMEHAQFRQYSMTQGRWFSPDPYSGSYDMSNPQSFNRYAYVLNGPLGTTDPSGLKQPPNRGIVIDPGWFDGNQPALSGGNLGWGLGSQYDEFDLANIPVDELEWGKNRGQYLGTVIDDTGRYDLYDVTPGWGYTQVETGLDLVLSGQLVPNVPQPPYPYVAPNNGQSQKNAQKISAVNNCQKQGQSAADAQPEVKPNGQDVLDAIYGGIGGLLTGGTGAAVSVGALVGLLSQSAGHAVQHGLAFLTSYHTCLASSGVGNAYNPYSPF